MKQAIDCELLQGKQGEPRHTYSEVSLTGISSRTSVAQDYSFNSPTVVIHVQCFAVSHVAFPSRLAVRESCSCRDFDCGGNVVQFGSERSQNTVSMQGNFVPASSDHPEMKTCSFNLCAVIAEAVCGTFKDPFQQPSSACLLCLGSPSSKPDI